MKLIKITYQNKANNPKLFGTRAIGSIARLSGRDTVNGLPNAYIGIEKVDGGYMYRTELHEQDGFFNEQIPVDGEDYFSATQYLGEQFFDVANKVFTRPILDKSPEQIADYTEQLLNSDNAQQLADKRIADGVENYRKLQAIIIRKYEAKEFSANTANNRALADGVMEYFSDNVRMITVGDWTVAKKKLLTAPASQNDTIEALYNQVKIKVDQYVLNNY